MPADVTAPLASSMSSSSSAPLKGEHVSLKVGDSGLSVAVIGMLTSVLLC